jgi:hypothetical protein
MSETTRPAGYEALIARYALNVIPNWHQSFVGKGTTRIINTTAGLTTETYPPKYWPGEHLGDQLEFALKYDGTNLALLASIFQKSDVAELQDYVASKPRGKYARRLWFLYEFLTGQTLSLSDLDQGAYIDLLEPEDYFTTSPGEKVRRQRINNNLLGDVNFCPTIRHTAATREFQAANLTERCQRVVSAYSPEVLKRALSYLYNKETKSSFEIEQIKPNPSRTERFIAMLQLAETEDFCDKQHFIQLQNQIVDPRFQDADYRQIQVYVGESVSWQREKIHFACPKPEDLHALMDGLVAAHRRMEMGNVSPVAHAAAIGFGFVFLHPFEDGNGRIHRFLIHNILARQDFTPEGIMFPVSASMLKNPSEYDACLEAFSRPLMPLIEYSLDEEGRMTVESQTAQWYAYIDMTAQTEALFRFIEHTIESELVEELSFLVSYDETKQAIQEVVDMPDRQIDLFIRFCLQNGGSLAARKRKSNFEFLTADEITKMEKAVQEAYGNQADET